MMQPFKNIEDLFKIIPVPAVLVKYDNGHIFCANDEFVNMFVKDGESCVGKTTLDLNIWTELKRREDFRKRLKKGETIKNEKITLFDKDGNKKVFLASMTINEDAIIETFFEVTEIEAKSEACINQKNAYQKLLNKYEKIITLTGTAFVILDDKFIIQEANDTMGEILSCAAFDIIGEKFIKLIDDVDSARDKISIKMGQMLSGNCHETISEEICIKKRDKTTQWVSLNAGTFGYNKIVCFMNNINEKKQKEQSRYIDAEKNKDKIRQRLSKFQEELKTISENSQRRR